MTGQKFSPVSRFSKLEPVLDNLLWSIYIFTLPCTLGADLCALHLWGAWRMLEVRSQESLGYLFSWLPPPWESQGGPVGGPPHPTQLLQFPGTSPSPCPASLSRGAHTPAPTSLRMAPSFNSSNYPNLGVSSVSWRGKNQQEACSQFRFLGPDHRNSEWSVGPERHQRF